MNDLDARMLKTLKNHLLKAMEEATEAELKTTVGRLAVCADLIGDLIDKGDRSDEPA